MAQAGFETGWRVAPVGATFWLTVENKGAQTTATAASVDQAASGWVFKHCFVTDVGYLYSEESACALQVLTWTMSHGGEDWEPDKRVVKTILLWGRDTFISLPGTVQSYGTDQRHQPPLRCQHHQSCQWLFRISLT